MGRRWTVVLLLGGIGCTSDPVEAMSEGGETEGHHTTSAPTTTSNDSGPASVTASDDGGSMSATATTSASTTDGTTSDGLTSTSESTSGDPPDSDTDSDTDSGTETSGSTDTGVMRVGCDDLAATDDPPGTCSQQASSEATFVVVNECETESIEVFWVDYGCSEIGYQVISPGNDWSIGSYETHPWRIRATSDARLLVDVPPLTGNTTVEVP